jgi:N-acetylglucosamine malate deacetylase 1
MKPISRRAALSRLSESGALAGASAVGLPLVGAEDQRAASASRLKVMVAGGHPDDPESGCGGTIARYTDLGREVVILYLTRGEAGIPGKSHDEAAVVRTAECQRACGILKARPMFAGQIDGSTEVNPERYSQFWKLVEAERPDLVFTHWPIDTHPDHRAASLLVYDAWLRSGRKFALFYFEVEQGSQTQDFRPTHYVDITSTESRKRTACFAHASQNPAEFYALHDMMNRFRGMECGARYAEAFVRHVQNDPGWLPTPSETEPSR